jgi:uroporphyrinogen-III synthase
VSNAGSALSGRRVVVTRAGEQARPLAQRLREVGAEPIEMPLIRITDPSDGGAAVVEAMSRLEDFDWLVVTSPNGAARVRASLPVASAPRTKIAAVGSATEAALGRRADLVPAVQTAVGLATEFANGSGAVLLIEPERSPDLVDGAASPLYDGLVSKGWAVTSVAAYRTVPVVPSSGDLLKVLAADAALFASGSAVRAWVAVFGTQTPAVTAAIGPSTAQVAGNLGLKIDVVATDHSVDGLVGCLLAYFAGSV